MVSELRLAFVCCTTSVNMIINGILNSTEAKAAVKDCPAILFVSLTETGVLMELREDFVQSWNRMIALQILQLLLDGPACQLIVLAFLKKMAMVARMNAIGK